MSRRNEVNTRLDVTYAISSFFFIYIDRELFGAALGDI